jgi:hypothetical protein
MLFFTCNRWRIVVCNVRRSPRNIRAAIPDRDADMRPATEHENLLKVPAAAPG